MNILVATLGASWPVLPEVLGFLRPDIVDLFAFHPDRERLEADRREHGLQPPEEFWVVTTEGTAAGQEKLAIWWRLLGQPLPLRVWITKGARDLASPEECRLMTELIWRVCLKASEEAGFGGQFIASLAGGRKTMSADIQRAGTMLGCAGLIHVIDNNFPARAPDPEFFTRPLPAQWHDADGQVRPCVGALVPVVVGRGHRAEFLEVSSGEWPAAVSAERFPVPLPILRGGEPIATCAWEGPTDEWLADEIRRRERASFRIVGNFLDEVARGERHENWRGLYRLPPSRIAALRLGRLGQEHAEWLRKLPKADLHCHLGGVLDVSAQVRVARVIWDSLTERERTGALEAVRPLIDGATRAEPWPDDWPAALGERWSSERPRRAAALLVSLPAEILASSLFGPTEPRFGLGRAHRLGFRAYELPGELSGSALLQSPLAVGEYARQVVRYCREQGVAYLELRGSPDKYLGGDAETFLAEFRAAIGSATGAGTAERSGVGEPIIRFVWCLDRRWLKDRPADTEGAVRRALLAVRDAEGFVVGLDVAGEESIADAPELARVLADAFDQCVPITIHAGETAGADNIWQAAYSLHADRIGHGLSLGDRPELAERFRNRRICVEMCPSSNLEVVGFFDPERPESEGLRGYPLLPLLRAGLPVAVCTDNPGISRTDPSRELVVAARLCGGELSLWDTLGLLRQGFVHAFAPARQKEPLLKAVDARIYQMLERVPEEDGV